jgi:hypothetical protein
MATEEKKASPPLQVLLAVATLIGRIAVGLVAFIWGVFSRLVLRRRRGRVRRLVGEEEPAQQPAESASTWWKLGGRKRKSGVYGVEALAEPAASPPDEKSSAFPVRDGHVVHESAEPGQAPPESDFEKAETLPQVEAAPEPGAYRMSTEEWEVETAEAMDRETFAKIMGKGEEDSLEAPAAGHPPARSTATLDAELSRELQDGLAIDQDVSVECLGSPAGLFAARVIHLDESQIIFMRSDDAATGATDIGDPVVFRWQDDADVRHEVAARVTNSSGTDSPWFSVSLSADGHQDAAQKGMNLPFGFYVVIDADDDGEARGHVTQRTAGVIRMAGTIREVDANGMLLETASELPESAFLVQDEKAGGILSQLDLCGYVVGCRRDLQAQSQFLSTVQFVNLSPSAEQQIRALTGKRFLGNL